MCWRLAELEQNIPGPLMSPPSPSLLSLIILFLMSHKTKRFLRVPLLFFFSPCARLKEKRSQRDYVHPYGRESRQNKEHYCKIRRNFVVHKDFAWKSTFPEGLFRRCAHLELISQNATGYSLTFPVSPSYGALSFFSPASFHPSPLSLSLPISGRVRHKRIIR